MSQATMKVLGEKDGRSSLKVSCTLCPYVVFATQMNDEPLTADEILRDHLTQHEPGRALDVVVDWEPSAICSVCEDGIGLIGWDEDGEGVKCKECGTTWSLDGTGGERLS